MQNKFKKIALVSVALLASVPAYSITNGGIAAASLGAAAGVGLIAYGIHKSHKNRDEKRNCKECSARTQSVKEMKKDKRMYESKLKDHKKSLRKLEKDGRAGSIAASQHRSEITKLETTIDDIKTRIAQAS